MTMLTIPAAIANFITYRLSTMMGSCNFHQQFCFCLTGNAMAYQFDWPTGATIALIAGIAYVICLFATKKLEVFISEL